MTPEAFFGLFNYWIVICLMMTGFYIVISSGNLIKTVIGLNIFQTSVFLLYITMGKITDATKRVTAPILEGGHGSHGDGHDDHATHGEHVAQVAFDQHVVGDQVATVAHEQTGHGHAGEHLHDSVDHAHEDLSEAGHAAVEHVHEAAEVIYSNPLPSVLMLTAIVVGIATTALALALIVRIREDYGSIEEDEILELDKEQQ